MRRTRQTFGVPVSLALMLALCACGHTGAGTGAASGGSGGGGSGGGGSGGGGGTPTSNSDFVSLAVNQSFTADFLATTFIRIDYDATTKGYTVTANPSGLTAAAITSAAAGDISQTFLPADLDTTATTSQIAVYAKVTGSTTDTLTLTKAGRSGRLTYQYVAGGNWQRSVTGSNGRSEELYPFVIGFPAAVSAVPRTGRAEYAVDLLGKAESGTGVVTLSGSGRTQVDFGIGVLVTHGTLTDGSTTFSSEARLASDANRFTGTFRLSEGGLLDGTLDGAFYGPEAQEIGAMFAVDSSDGSRFAVGSIIGRKGTAPAQTNPSFVAPAFNEFFTNDAARLSGGQAVAASGVIVNYDANLGKYTLIDGSNSQFFGSLSVPESGDTLTLLPLSGYQYVRGAEWRGGTGDILDFAFGVETTDTALPRTGTAGYVAQIAGSARDAQFGSLLGFSGAGLVTADFGAGTIGADLDLHFVHEVPGAPASAGDGNLQLAGTISVNANLFSGTATMDGIGSYSGGFDGRFYGPAAEELGLAFHLTDGIGGAASGVLTAFRDNSATGTNTSLTNLVANQFFPAISSGASATILKSGAAQANSLAAEVASIRFVAGTRGYVVAAGSRSQDFLPLNIDSNQTTSQIAVYAKVNGSTTDTLTLTKAGTSGRFTYQYVAGGNWLRQIDGPTSIAGSMNAFVYGFPSATGVVPRTGRAEYAVDLLGRETTAGGVFNLTGSGRTQVDFGTGVLVTHGTLNGAIDGSTSFSSEARLASDANRFAGTFRFSDSGLFDGTLDGAFYGPAAQEIGAIFAAETSDGRVAVGSIVGRQGAAPEQTNPSVVAPAFNEFFTNDAARLSGGQAVAASGVIVNYDANLGKYTLIDGGNSQFFESLSVPESGDTLTLLPLNGYQFVRGAEWRGGTGDILDFAFGVETTDAALPRTGTAGYAAQILGSAKDGDYANLVSFSGTGTVVADFGASTITAALGVHHVHEAPTGSVPVANGGFVASGTISASANLFSGTATMDGIGSYSGGLNGRFYGSAAEELGLAFHLTDGLGGAASGLVIGRRDADVTRTLSTLASPIEDVLDFGSSRYLLLGTGSPVFSSNASLSYDKATQTYFFQATGDGVVRTDPLFSPAGITSSDATITNYAYDNGAGVTATAAILNSGAGNPAIQLTYASFADIFINVTTGSPTDTHYYYPFGVDTPLVQIPQFGTATYAGYVRGSATVIPTSGAPKIYDSIDASSSLVVDFGASTFTHSLTITDASGGGNLHRPLGTFTGTGTINSSAVMSGNYAGGASGTWRGAFYGPAAQEFGAVFNISNTVSSSTATDGDQQRINGVTVGKKVP